MTTLRFGAVIVAIGVLGLGTAYGASTKATCIAQARTAKQSCVKDCQTSFQDARIGCLNIDPTCAAACESTEATCTAPFLAILGPCLDTCDSQLQTAKQACPPLSDPTHADCIDQAQLAAFNCRDTCRDDPQVSPGLQECRQAYYACLKGCPPAQ